MKKKQSVIIIVLGILIVLLGVAFATTSTILNIASSANVNPKSEDFSIVFSASNQKYVVSEIEAKVENAGAIGKSTVTTTDGLIDNSIHGKPRLTNLSAIFTRPGQKAKYSFYVYNNGKYDAYLTNIVFNKINGYTDTKKCIAREGTYEGYVIEACKGIKYTITVDGTAASESKTIKRKKIGIDKFKLVTIEIEYSKNAERADGPFEVEFGDIELNYNTNDKSISK